MINRLFLYFCTLLSVLVSLSGFLSIKTINDLPFHLLFLPITLYLVITSFKSPSHLFIPSHKKSLAFFLSVFVILLITKIISFNKPQQPASVAPSISFPTPTSIPTPTPTSTQKNDNDQEKTVTTTADLSTTVINIRSQPSTTSPVIKKTTTEVIYPLIDKQGDWYQVKLEDGTTGYIFKDFIK